MANSRAANTETLKILTLPKEAPSKTETQNSLKTGAIPITTSYLSVLYVPLYFYVLSFS